MRADYILKGFMFAIGVMIAQEYIKSVFVSGYISAEKTMIKNNSKLCGNVIKFPFHKRESETDDRQESERPAPDASTPSDTIS